MTTSLTTIGRRYGLRLVVLALVIAAFFAISPTFRGVSTIYSLLEQFAFVGLVALGIGITMIVGELDLSVASMAAFMGVVAIHASAFGLVPAILVGVVGGALLGAGQGFVIAKLGINSLVLTVGTMLLLRGATYVVSGGQPIIIGDFALTDPLHIRWGIVSPASVLALVVIAVLGAFLAWTRPGRNLYATGGARAEARAAGVPIRRSLTTAFAMSGGLAGLAGALACLKGGSAAPEAFPDLLLLGAGAAMIGGISLAGGAGTVWNVVLGVGITGALAVGMATLAGPSYVSSLMLGILLIAILIADYVTRRVRTRSALAALRQQTAEAV